MIDETYGNGSTENNICRKWFATFTDCEFNLNNIASGGRSQWITRNKLETRSDDGPTQSLLALAVQNLYQSYKNG